MYWLFLFIAIFCEIAASSLLKISDGFTKLWPSLGTLAGYVICFYFFGLALKKIDISVAYAIWSACGIVVLTVVGALVFKESMNPVKIISILLIIAGVIGLNLSGSGH